MAEPSPLERRLGLTDAVIVGLGSMIGAGIFAALSPAAAGSGLLIGPTVAAVGAYRNATPSARLAARYPQSGGTNGRDRDSDDLDGCGWARVHLVERGGRGRRQWPVIKRFRSSP